MDEIISSVLEGLQHVKDDVLSVVLVLLSIAVIFAGYVIISRIIDSASYSSDDYRLKDKDQE